MYPFAIQSRFTDKNKTMIQLIAMKISINLTYISLALSFLELLKKNGSIPNE